MHTLTPRLPFQRYPILYLQCRVHLWASQCGVSFALSVLCELNNVAAGCLGAVRLAGWSPGSGTGHASATVRVRLLGLGRDERAAKSLPSVGAVLPLLWLANTTTTDTRGLCVVHAAAQAANRTHLGAFLAKDASNSPQQGLLSNAPGLVVIGQKAELRRDDRGRT